MSNIKSVIVVIDTERHAGDFEREMCAFITGQVGECGVGMEFVEDAEEEIESYIFDWFTYNVAQELDEDEDSPCARPCAVWSTPGYEKDTYKYRSVAIFFDKVPPQNILDLIWQRANSFANDRPDICFYRQPSDLRLIVKLNLSGMRVLEPKIKTKVKKVKLEEVIGYSDSKVY